MNNPICKKVISMLALYIENKLDETDRLFIENHFFKCRSCYEKYKEMKEIIDNLHFEYEKLIDEFEKIEANKIFNIREYEHFVENISPYIDDELCYDDSIKFRRYLLKSKQARTELANAYGLKNNIRHSVAIFKDNTNVNFSKKVLKRLNSEHKDSFDTIYKRAAIVLGFMITSLIIFTVYMGISYFNESIAKESTQNTVESTIFPSDEEYVEFIFDNNEALLTAK